MSVNPFIRLALDAVETLAYVGFGLFLLTIILSVLSTTVVAIPWSIRTVAKLIVRYHSQKHTDKWWSFGDRRAGYIPPAGWTFTLLGVCLVYVGLVFLLAITAWAAGALIWLVGL